MEDCGSVRSRHERINTQVEMGRGEQRNAMLQIRAGEGWSRRRYVSSDVAKISKTLSQFGLGDARRGAKIWALRVP